MLTLLPTTSYDEDLSRAEATAVLVEELEHSDGAEAERIRERLIEVNLDLARTLARRYYGHGERSDDLDQTAYLGLTMAARRFEPDRAQDFLAFAVPTILGELRRHFRDRCWMVRPPRRIQELQARMMPAVEAYSQEHGRLPDPGELGEELGEDVDDVTEALTADGCFTPTSLDRPLDPASSADLGDMLSEEDHDLALVEAHELIRGPFARLTDREHRIVELRFFWDWTQSRIAEEIGVTQMQVSRILARILRQLREEVTQGRSAA